MKKSRICLFFSDTGGGHRSACEAIEAALRESMNSLSSNHGKPELLVENIVEKSHPVNRYFVEFYNYLLRHNQAGMKYYYWFIENTKPNNSELGYRLAKPYLISLLNEINADVIVSVHPMSNHYLARAIQDTGRAGKTKLITVVTDPNGDFWSGWACHDADLTIVPNDLGKATLVKHGIDQHKIKVLGMPVHPEFSKPVPFTPEEFRTRMGLSPDLPTLCLNSGWAGGGNILSVYEALNYVDRRIQIIFLCGQNQELYTRATELAANSKHPTAVLPFHDRMSDLMTACDLMVTKAGGLTTFEAVARKLPLAIDMITKPMPQELGTANLLCQEGLAHAIKAPEDIIPIALTMRTRKEIGNQPLPSRYQLDKTRAVHDIAEAILAETGVNVFGSHAPSTNTNSTIVNPGQTGSMPSMPSMPQF